ncbi:M15 family metallopeptidase [Candidatus Saccharibacteria bacterium]|nr:M15 family metallopeptidase [Candidatus Saccharibacteria bacterium]
MKRFVTIVGVVAIVLAVTWFWLGHSKAPTTQQTATTTSPSSQQTSTKTTATFNKTRYSLTQPTSIWVIVNKQHPLQPKTYVPSDLVLPDVTQRVPGTTEMKLRKAAAVALEKMFAAAAKQNINLLVSTAYRGYSYQATLYNGYVARQGKAVADTQSARPGYSEHQTGWAVDIRAQSGKCPVEQCFGNLPEGKWLAANAYKYGFLLRYPEGKQKITGYEYEPWHFRYIGTYLSKEMHRTGTETMEEFFDVSGGTSY